VKVIKFRRNSGQSAAMVAGIEIKEYAIERIVGTVGAPEP
jgi:hypothetical protein